MGNIFEFLVGTAVLGATAYLKGKEFKEDGEKELRRNGIYEDEASSFEKMQIGANKALEKEQKKFEKRVEQKRKN